MKKIMALMFLSFIAAGCNKATKLPSTYVCGTPLGGIQTSDEDTKITRVGDQYVFAIPGKEVTVPRVDCIIVKDIP